MALISPPDEPLDSFSQPSSPAVFTAQATTMTPISQSKIPSQELSFARHPPTPQSPAISTFELAARFRNWSAEFSNGRSLVANPDPILYPEQRQSTEYNPPLFVEEHSSEKLQSPPAFLKRHKFDIPAPASVQSAPTTTASSVITSEQPEPERLKAELIDDHYKTRVLPQYVQSKSKVTKWSSPKRHMLPTREQYKLVLDVAWKSVVMKDYNTDPSQYLKRQLQENEENWQANKRQRVDMNSTTVLKPKETKAIATLVHPPRVRKPAKKPIDRSGTPEVKHRRTAAKKTKVEFNYDDVPDYTPSLSTLPADKNFRVNWNGHVLDLSRDPNNHLLHPAELQLASKLRFPCDQYLKTKRRVFVGRVNSLIKHPNKQFCKTDAQQVGGVDVNKLSQLWEAYNSIGWFDVAHFKNHVDKVRNSALVYDPKNTKWVERQDFFGF
ncbi:MAG: hypothetical protein GOMPHAMPRED_000636 [Gomphillus americanus]|uniref:SWIRM domain-containing protein n=1 Tax=Gomphillus americanus TaxID=1940652 RepID=A0A8H3EEA1_9LECA|nr:MAG: hypothetical protein GOMPHAMPRED_000636 [Gomphillus americanus]